MKLTFKEMRFTIEKNHEHHWIYLDRGIGVYTKGKQNIEVHFDGFASYCRCTKRQFTPDDYKLQPVEIE